jgi:DnaJ-class molecular chaperone
MRTFDEDLRIHYLIPVGCQDGEIIRLSKIGNIIFGNNTRTDIVITIKIVENGDFNVVGKDLNFV